MNSTQYFEIAQKTVAHRTELERQKLEKHGMAVIRAWGELQDHLRQAANIDDLIVAPWTQQEAIHIPVTGTLVRLRFPALEELAGREVEVLASVITTVSSMTGEVLFARVHQYYKNGKYGIVPTGNLDEAIVSAVEAAEIDPAPEEEAA